MALAVLIVPSKARFAAGQIVMTIGVDTLVAAEYTFENRAHFGEKFLELREAYEPFINTLADYCLFAVPPIMSDQPVVDNWQTSSWMRRTQGLGKLAESTPDDHDD